MQKFHIKAADFSTDMATDAVLDANDPALTINETPEENLIKDIKRLAGVVGNEGVQHEYTGYNTIPKSAAVNMTTEANEKIKIQEENNIEPGSPKWFRLWFNQPHLTGETALAESLNVGFGTISVAKDYEDTDQGTFPMAYAYNNPGDKFNVSKQQEIGPGPEDYQNIFNYVVEEIRNQFSQDDAIIWGSDITPEIDARLKKDLATKVFIAWTMQTVQIKSYNQSYLLFTKN